MAESNRKIFIGGNWKSNNTLDQTEKLISNTLNQISVNKQKMEIIVAPVFIQIPFVQQKIQKDILVAAQNCSLTGQGAYTGEIAPEQIKDLGINWVIIGHSERRQYYGETDDVVAGKTANALKVGLSVIACIGEKLEEREAGKTIDVCKRQLEAIVKKVQINQWQNIVVAYEPVWAIGTGKVATPEQAEEVHNFIRQFFTTAVSKEVANSLRIIYGGSVNEKNSGDLIKQPNIDGFLVGGASLKPEFAGIIKNSCL